MRRVHADLEWNADAVGTLAGRAEAFVHFVEVLVAHRVEPARVQQRVVLRPDRPPTVQVVVAVEEFIEPAQQVLRRERNHERRLSPSICGCQFI